MIDLGRGVSLITRSEWEARAPRSTTGINPTYGSTAHWEGPHMGWPWSHSACYSLVRGIQNFHMDGRGWVDIAYSGLPCPHGYVFQGRWVGRRTAANGTNDGNSRAYALCYLGGQGDRFTSDGKRAMRASMDYLDAHGAGPGRNGHRDWKPTECPGNAIYSWVRSGQPAGGSTPPLPTPKEGFLMALSSADQKTLFDRVHKIDMALQNGPGVKGNYLGRDIKGVLVPGVERLLARDSTTLVAPVGYKRGEPVYLTDFMTKTRLKHGGPLHEFLRDIAKMLGRDPNAVRIDRKVLDEIPTVKA